MKRIFCSLALLTLAGLLLSCSNDNQKRVNRSFLPVEVWYGTTYSEAGQPPETWSFYRIVREELGIDLKLVPNPSNDKDATAKIEAAAAANALPDFFMVTRNELNELIKRNQVAYVDDMFAMMPTRTKNVYNAECIAAVTMNGHVWGLAQEGSIPKNEGVLIRKDWLDKLGLDVPKTTDEFMEVMRAFTFSDPDGNGRPDTYGFGAFLETRTDELGLGRRFAPFFGAFGVAGTFNFTQDERGLNIYKPEFMEALKYIREMVKEGVIDPNWIAYNKNDFRAAWKSGRFGIMREQNSAAFGQQNYTAFDENFPDGEWIVIDPPVGPEGKSSVGAYNVNSGHRIYAVSQKAVEEGKKNAITRLLEWMSSPRGYYLLGYGERDVNYKIDMNGEITAEGLSNPELAYSSPEFAPYLQLRNLVFYNNDEELAGRYPSWTSKNGRTISPLNALREMQSKPWTNVSQLVSPSKELQQFYNEGVTAFVTGARPLDDKNWNDWMFNFEKLGGNAWEEECVRFVDENNLWFE